MQGRTVLAGVVCAVGAVVWAVPGATQHEQHQQPGNKAGAAPSTRRAPAPSRASQPAPGRTGARNNQSGQDHTGHNQGGTAMSGYGMQSGGMSMDTMMATQGMLAESRRHSDAAMQALDRLAAALDAARMAPDRDQGARALDRATQELQTVREHLGRSQYSLDMGGDLQHLEMNPPRGAPRGGDQHGMPGHEPGMAPQSRGHEGHGGAPSAAPGASPTRAPGGAGAPHPHEPAALGRGEAALPSLTRGTPGMAGARGTAGNATGTGRTGAAGRTQGNPGAGRAGGGSGAGGGGGAGGR